MRSYKNFNEFKSLTSFELGDTIRLRMGNEIRNALITAYDDKTITFGSEVFRFEDLNRVEYMEPKDSSWKHLAVDAMDEKMLFTFAVGRSYTDGLEFRFVNSRYTEDGEDFVVFNNSEVARVYQAETEERARLTTGAIVKATNFVPYQREIFYKGGQYWLKDMEGLVVGTVKILSRFSDAGEDFVSCEISIDHSIRTVDKQKIIVGYNESFHYGDFFCSPKFIIEG